MPDHAAPVDLADVARTVDAVADVVTVISSSAIEPKVKASTAASSGAAIVLAFVLWLLSSYVFHGDVPLPVSAFAGLVIVGGSTFAAGYLAPHVNRGSVAPVMTPATLSGSSR
jgi:hypothetical protein